MLNTLVPLATSFTLMFWGLSNAWWLTVLLLPVTALLFVRTFTIMHDCSHGSFTGSKKANEIIGFMTGVLTLTPFSQWRRDHALHHASSGDLDRRGHGDIDRSAEEISRPRSITSRTRLCAASFSVSGMNSM
jgi:omega-6 fatty acid desaturase (delta-12 desaturase)